MLPAGRSAHPSWGPAPLYFRSPILPASGALGYGPELARTVPLERLGAFVTGSVGTRTQRGTVPRVSESVAGAVYTPGTGSLGVGAALRRYGPAWATLGLPVIVNLAGVQAADFAASAAALEGTTGVVALELDFVRGVQDDVRTILARVRERCALPLIAKLSPATPALADLIAQCAEGRAAAVTVGGGYPVGEGALVGPATFPLVLHAVRQAVEVAVLPLIAGGGVVAVADAVVLLEAGAVAVQVGSAHLANPRAAVEIAMQIERE